LPTLSRIRATVRGRMMRQTFQDLRQQVEHEYLPKQLIIGALLQVVSISLGVCLGYLAFVNVFSILDR
jgi:hypothetical protein